VLQELHHPGQFREFVGLVVEPVQVIIKELLGR
jgi:hypothetical protein